jgi:hypothetical protein
MLFCQLGQAHSLREICGSLAAALGKIRLLGLIKALSRSTLAYANEHRPLQLYEQLFYQLQGLVCSKNQFYRILRNPVYIGKIIIKAWRDDPEVIVDG